MFEAKVTREFLFAEDRPFASCHASTLLALPGGDVLAAWFGGTREKAPDVAIWGARRSAGRWSHPRKLADREGIAHWNPVLFANDRGSVFLVYKVGVDVTSWHSMVMRSDDGGESWSDPVPLVEGDIGGRGPVRNKPIRLRDGKLLAPASIETADRWDAFVDISTDQGLTWRKSAFVPIDHGRFEGKGVIQPTLWESEPGKVHMLLRSTAGRIYRSDSFDGGQTWCPAYATSLPNNNSGIDLVRLDSGVLALVCNPVGENWGKRTPLTLFASTDNGLTWGDELVLEDGPGEYSYPAIIAKGNRILISYTWKRERIAYWELETAE
jgi:predicted neuraminidase